MSRTAYVYDPRFLLHDPGVDTIVLPSGNVLDPEPHPANVRIARRTAQLIANSGLPNELVELPARPCSLADLELVHRPDYVERVREVTHDGGGSVPGGTPVVDGSWTAALLAAGTAVVLVDAVLDAIVGAAFGLVRPPGHHATPDHGAGFCVFNNVAVAATHARARRGVGRVAIVDWDVHHGSGTQAIYWDDPDVLLVSLHQERWFPGASGAAEEVGGERARGRTVNIPLPPGTGDRGYLRAFNEVAVPVLRGFRPELIIVAAGQDASLLDPLGRMLLTTDGFRTMAGRLREVAHEVCDGRIVALQEGGYSPTYTPFCTLAVLEGIVGVRTEVADPLAGSSQLDEASRRWTDDEQAAVRRAQQEQRRWWDLGA